MIEEDTPRFLRRDLVFAQVSAQRLRCLGPQRATAFLPALAAQPHARGRIEGQIARLYSHDFADPGPCVEQERQEGMITAPIRCRAINAAENRFALRSVYPIASCGTRPSGSEAPRCKGR